MLWNTEVFRDRDRDREGCPDQFYGSDIDFESVRTSCFACVLFQIMLLNFEFMLLSESKFVTNELMDSHTGIKLCLCLFFFQ
jgi:hypothetical protein